MYLILFKCLRKRKEEIQNSKSLDYLLQKRQRKNVITLSGQGFNYAIEFVILLIAQFSKPSPLEIIQFLQILLVLSCFLTSSELKQFYFKRK